jgi:uncharacterized protein
MKKLISILLCLSFLLILPLGVSASSPCIVDEAGLLTADEAALLEEKAALFQRISDMEAVILTVDSLNGKTAMAYADDYFDANYGENGILLLIAMAEREWHISTTGTAIEAFDDVDLMGLEDTIMTHLPDGEYFEAFDSFLSDCEYYLTNEPVSDFEACLFIAVPAGLILSGIVLLIMIVMMRSNGPQHSAAGYTVDNSYNLRTRQDLFLYSQVSKRAKPKESSSSSSTHTSSSGRTHGGRGGSF